MDSGLLILLFGSIFKKYTDDEGKVVTVAKQKKEYRQGIDNRVAESVRKTRNQKLKETDWTQIPDCTVDKIVWKEYRQELRDISTQEGFPHDITWILRNLIKNFKDC